MSGDLSRPSESWIPRRWIAGAVLVVMAVGGLAVAKDAAGNGTYWGGLALFVVATLGVFAVISTSYGRSPLARIDPFPAHGALRWALGGVVAVIAVAGLFHAKATPAGSFGYDGGLGAFVIAVAYGFVLLKDWFDRQERAARR